MAKSPPIAGYAAGLKESLLCLISNAVEAMLQGGTVVISTRMEKGELILEVRDNGSGIPAYRIDRVFDAFFTSKGPSHSGLGLSIARNLVTQQGGRIKISSEEGRGTTATIVMPVASGDCGSPLVDSAAELVGELSVLVVEDEPQVAEVFRNFLEAAGHRPVVCNDGQSAIETFQQGAFDLAMLDLGMLEMDGWELSRRLHEIRPDLPVILATGWDVSVEDGRPLGVEVQGVLKKPFSMQELAEALDMVVTSGAP